MRSALLLIVVFFLQALNLFAEKPKHPAASAGNAAGATLSYNGSQTYTVGTAITPLTPTSSGVAALAYASPVSLGSGFSLPTGLAVDASGNLYVADAGNNAVKK